MQASRVVGALTVVLTLVLGVAATGGAFGEGRTQSATVMVAGVLVRSPEVHKVAHHHKRDRRNFPEHTTTTRPRPHTTTSTTLPATTTTVPQTTTTVGGTSTTADTTTTTAPTTTTTAPTTTTSPPTSTTTQPLPTPSGDRLIALLRGQVNGREEVWWDANYFRNLPFTAGTGWTDGDRAGYRCMYTFLLLNGEPVGRVTFTTVPEAQSYTVIIDKFMEEGIRHYDGTLAAPGEPKELGECPAPTQDYQPFTGSDQRPTITYSTVGADLLEVRNYKPLVVGEGISFQQTESSPQKITVVAYQNNNPVIVVYYESMSPNVVMASDL